MFTRTPVLGLPTEGKAEMTYKVMLKPLNEGAVEPQQITVVADDVELDSCGEDGCRSHYFNFTKPDRDDKETSITVAAIPFESVLYITS
jgi:hypothetical protein